MRIPIQDLFGTEVTEAACNAKPHLNWIRGVRLDFAVAGAFHAVRGGFHQRLRHDCKEW